MFLRSLYGSRMPQALHPRSDEQAASYWREDTETSRELARAMEEADGDMASDGALKKASVCMNPLVGDDGPLGVRRGVQPLSIGTHLGEQLNGSSALELEGLALDNLAVTWPLQTQLSPTGLISIAAADIDEAHAAEPLALMGDDGELNLALLDTLRRTGSMPVARSSHRDALRHVLGSPPPPSARFTEEEQEQRFLNLLRRVNELRSQQVEDDDTAGGLPYPQILALPTFQYSYREKDPSMAQENLCCAVCLCDYAPQEDVRALPCLHFYHRECIDQWLMDHRKCPICKHQVAVY